MLVLKGLVFIELFNFSFFSVTGWGIPYIQSKRNPSKMVGVARGHRRADTLKPYAQKTSQSNHTRTTALSNSMKLSHAMWGHTGQVGLGGEV